MRPLSAVARRATVLALILTLVAIGVTSGNTSPSLPVRAAGPLTWTYKNFTMASYSQYDLYNSASTPQQLVDAGATSVTFTMTWYTGSIYSTDIYRTGDTATDDALVYAIGQAQQKGLQVMLKPHLDSQDGQWRAGINPGSGAADLWFSNYTVFLDHYADIGAQHGAILLCIGAELISMSTNPDNEGRWRALIAHERARFGGKLTYSANWGGPGFAEEWSRLPFWDALDYLGLSAYFNLSDTTTPNLADLNATWADYKANTIAPFQRRWNKPLLFTEGGYRSVNIASKNPWDASTSGPSDPQQQALCYESLFETWGNVSWFAGGMFWYWKPSASNVDPNDTDYEVQNKPAYNTVSAWFKSSPPAPTATASPTATATSTPTPTATATPVPTAMPTAVPTATATRVPTATATSKPATATPTSTLTRAAAPTIQSLSPTSGSSSGGIHITITGANFASGATVRFGDAPATIAGTGSATSIIIIAPPHSVGIVDVTVANPDGQSVTLARAYTYVAPGIATPMPPSFVPTHIPAATTRATPNPVPATHPAGVVATEVPAPLPAPK